MKISEILSQKPEKLSQGFQLFCWLLLTTILLTFMMTSVLSDYLQPVAYKEGNVAKQSVRSTHDFFIEDTEITNKRREEATRDVKSVFIFDNRPEEGVRARVESLFQALQDIGHLSEEDSKQLTLSREERVNFESQFRIDFAGKEWNFILDTTYWAEIEEAVVRLVNPILNRGVLANKRFLREALKGSGAVLRRKTSGVEQEIYSESTMYDLNEAMEVLESTFPAKGFGKGNAYNSLIKKLGRYGIKANILFDSDITEAQIEQVRNSVDPFYTQVKRGEVIVRAGDLVNENQQRKLENLQAMRGSTDLSRTAAGYVILTLLILLSVFLFTSRIIRNFRPTNRDIGLVVATLIGSFLLVKSFSVLGNALSFRFPDINPLTWILASPIAAGGILLNVTLGTGSVLFFVLAFGLLTGVYLENSWLFLLLVIVGNIVGATSVEQCPRRSAFVVAGIRVALINMLIILCFVLLYPQLGARENTVRLLCAIFGGLTAGIVATGLTPIAEYIGGYITNIKLLELASLDRPLLRELSVQAPGTWNHSVVIGQMGEAAAEAVGANGLLTRVGAYYHDIGKIKKPAYFTENQIGTENRHEKLTPSMSALIIRAHVKDGMEMAKQARLPQAVMDFIPEHHGTSLIEYFFEKAKKEAEDPETVDESHFRYGGPKPQTKESGILMLGDQVEATARSMSGPTPAKIQGLVQKVINRVFTSGELDESELTLKDLHLIAKSFTRVLNAIYHRRVEYFEPAEKTRAKSDDEKQEKALSEKGAEKRGERRAEKRESGKNVEKNTSGSHGQTDSSKKTEADSSEKENNGNGKETLKRLGM